MFTGLIEGTGTVRRFSRGAGAAVVEIAAPFARALRRGESVAVNGVCLTATRIDGPSFRADLVDRTLELTTLGGLRVGDAVNLERALALGDRLGGHLVSGHIDGVGEVLALERSGRGAWLEVKLEPELLRHIAVRGSIAVDGASLTVAGVSERSFSVALIPETLEATIARSYAAGTPVNVETDILAKYVESLARSRAVGPSDPGEREDGDRPGLTLERLRELGFAK